MGDGWRHIVSWVTRDTGRFPGSRHLAEVVESYGAVAAQVPWLQDEESALPVALLKNGDAPHRVLRDWNVSREATLTLSAS